MNAPARPEEWTFAHIGLPRITVNPAVMTGQPCIRGLRMPVVTLMKLIAAGWTTDQVLREYPFLEPEDLHQALSFAAWHTDEHYLPLTPAP